MVHFQGIAHFHLKVSNIDRSVQFYQSAFGMHVIAKKYEGKMVVLMLKDHADILTLSEGAIGAEVHPNSAEVGNHGGFDHFGFSLTHDSNLKEAVVHLEKMGAQFIQYMEIAPGVNSAFFKDPDAYVFQIWALPKQV